MKASRELDALVAEKVMGIKFKTLESPKDVWEWVFSDDDYEIPHYSTDIAAAWQVIEKLNLDDFTIGRPEPFSKNFVCSLSIYSKNPWKYFSAKSDTASKAICLAALKAVGVEV